MAKRVSIKDIARHLGINPSTVSRVLSPNSRAKISDDVIARVNTAAKDLGYINNATAASLRTQQTKTIGMIVPDLLNPMFASIICGAQQYLNSQEYVLLITCSNNNICTALNETTNLLSRQVDGIIFASAFLEDDSVGYCLEQGAPLVLVNRTLKSNQLVHQVLCDDERAMQLVVEHLAELGHRRLIHFAGPQSISQGKTRQQSFLTSCKALKLKCEIIETKGFTIEAGQEAASQFIDSNLNATALIAANDMIAIGVMDYLQQRGFNIPADVSITGVNNTFLTDKLTPSLTTVDIPHQQLGIEAAKLLLQEIAKPCSQKKSILLPPQLIIRKSTAKSPSGKSHFHT